MQQEVNSKQTIIVLGELRFYIIASTRQHDFSTHPITKLSDFYHLVSVFRNNAELTAPIKVERDIDKKTNIENLSWLNDREYILINNWPSLQPVY